MVNEQTVCPVSGEIMTDPRPLPQRISPPDDIVDAEYESVCDLRPDRERHDAARPEAAMSRPAGMDILSPAARTGPSRASPLFWLGGSVIALAAFWVSGGHVLGGLLLDPSAARTAEALRLLDVRSHVEESGRLRVLYVDGAVANDGEDDAQMPQLVIAVRGDDGGTTRYILPTLTARIEPGERRPFSSRLEVPTGGVAGVVVTMKQEGGA